MAVAVSDSELAAYRPRLERLASRFAGRPYVDQDDLVQEGWILLWESRKKGHEATDEQILKRMRGWATKMNKQRLGIPPRSRVKPEDVHVEIVSYEEHGDRAVEE
jgi:Sigma-70 region 2